MRCSVGDEEAVTVKGGADACKCHAGAFASSEDMLNYYIELYVLPRYIYRQEEQPIIPMKCKVEYIQKEEDVVIKSMTRTQENKLAS